MLVVVLVASAAPGSSRAAATPGAEAPPIELQDPAIAESSGLAASRRQPGVLWTHNDSGDGPHLYATDRAGRAVGTFEVTGATHVDWEDLALGPGADGTDALYVADTGDNAGRRAEVAILRLPEPTVAPTGAPPDPPDSPGPAIQPTAAAERFPVVYPDGPHDVEAMLVHPASGEVLLVTKQVAGPAVVFRLPPLVEPDRPLTPTPVATIDLPGFGPLGAATGGAVSADGTRLLLRTPTTALEWIGAPGLKLAETLTTSPRRVSLPRTPRGEAVAYRPDGAALVLTTEGVPALLYECPIAAAT